MDIGIKHWLLLISIILLIYVFYRVIQTRLFHVNSVLEGMEDNSKEEKSIVCKNDYSNKDALPLREYVIKSSFNSCYDGTGIKLETLERNLADGYRFIDLNVFSASGGLYVGYSHDNSPTMVEASLEFSKVLQFIKDNAFVQSKLPPVKKKLLEVSPPDTPGAASIHSTYINYPIFVNIRMYRGPTSNIDILGKIVDMLKETSDNRFYRADGKAIPIDGCTSIDQIRNKIIISMDITNIIQIYAPTDKPSATEIGQANIDKLNTVVNIWTGGSTWRAFYKYTDTNIESRTKTLMISDPKNKYRTNVFAMYISYPYPDDKSNPDVYKYVLQYSIQTVVNRVYLDDDNLKQYVELFDYFKTPFIPLAYVYNYVNTK